MNVKWVIKSIEILRVHVRLTLPNNTVNVKYNKSVKWSKKINKKKTGSDPGYPCRGAQKIMTFVCVCAHAHYERETRSPSRQGSRMSLIFKQRRRSWGGGGRGAIAPHENIGGQTYNFPPPPIISTTWKLIIRNARIGLKSTVRHYKTIKFNIKILLNVHSLKFCGALLAQTFILRLCAPSAPKDLKFFVLLPPPPPPPPPPPQSENWIDALFLSIQIHWGGNLCISYNDLVP